jgi:integrase
MPITRQRYQSGTVQKVKRAKGPQMWVYRWRVLAPDGTRVQRKQTIGSVEKYKTESAAMKAVESLRAQANADVPLSRPDDVWTFEKLWGHFQEHELEKRRAERSPTTIDKYGENMRLYVLPYWKDTPIEQFNPVDVEDWLGTLLRKDGRPLAPGTKVKIRNQLRVIFYHALRRKLLDPKLGPNPIELVRQSGQRQRIPDTLTVREIVAIIAHVKSPLIRTVIYVAAETGLRRSELRGLRWSDIDFDGLWIKVERGVVESHITRGKTEESRKGVPMSPDLANILTEWKAACLYKANGDWVFASVQTSGRTPVWLEEALKAHVRPAAQEAGITTKQIGWHSFRHSLGTILATAGENMKTTQGLLRHRQIATTANLYTRDDDDAKRAAQRRMGGMYLVKTGS